MENNNEQEIISQENVLHDLIKNAETLTKEDLEKKYTEQVLIVYKPNLDALIRKIWKCEVPEVTRKSFQEEAKVKICKSLITFFEKQHWKFGRNLHHYLLGTIKNFAISHYWSLQDVKRQQVLICPGCKYLNDKSWLHPEDKLQRCFHCSKEIDRIEEELKKSNLDVLDQKYLKERLNLHNIFALHSRKGFRCSDCDRFIPINLASNQNIICPYPDCIYFGNITDLLEMGHPALLIPRKHTSLDAPHKNSTTDTEFSMYDLIESNQVAADTKIEMKEQFGKEFETLTKVINDQIQTVKRINAHNTCLQKLCMYEAFQQMIEEDPAAMVSYLVHQKQSSDLPIQAKIFQYYVNNIQNCLPIVIDDHDVISILDPFLNIFEGKSVFETTVDKAIIKNETIESYIGVRDQKEFERCFIGKLLDVISIETGKSIKQQVKQYSFGLIELKTQEYSGKKIRVSHYRLIPHYEMKSLVYLQRIRLAIVDSVYRRLHGYKRPVGKQKIEQQQLKAS